MRPAEHEDRDQQSADEKARVFADVVCSPSGSRVRAGLRRHDHDRPRSTRRRAGVIALGHGRAGTGQCGARPGGGAIRQRPHWSFSSVLCWSRSSCSAGRPHQPAAEREKQKKQGAQQPGGAVSAAAPGTPPPPAGRGVAPREMAASPGRSRGRCSRSLGPGAVGAPSRRVRPTGRSATRPVAGQVTPQANESSQDRKRRQRDEQRQKRLQMREARKEELQRRKDEGPGARRRRAAAAAPAPVPGVPPGTRAAPVDCGGGSEREEVLRHQDRVRQAEARGRDGRAAPGRGPRRQRTRRRRSAGRARSHLRGSCRPGGGSGAAPGPGLASGPAPPGPPLRPRRRRAARPRQGCRARTETQRIGAEAEQRLGNAASCSPVPLVLRRSICAAPNSASRTNGRPASRR